jgi:hypothetical protein
VFDLFEDVVMFVLNTTPTSELEIFSSEFFEDDDLAFEAQLTAVGACLGNWPPTSSSGSKALASRGKIMVRS